ncbi:MAG: hypothetical protein JSW26_16770 [Desulfobacterales bacterium]|nr:MAG: hypothetical protein JSW26_16770 [Desulfobacterales bacterium]
MISVQKVSCAAFADINPILTEIWGKGSEAKWRKLFDYTWERDEDYCGLVLKDAESTVGFLGMIFSRRRINQNPEKFCNLTSWFVHEDYRIKAMSMLLPLLAMKDYTITDLTPAKNVYRIQQRIGFKDLDAKGRILLPFGGRRARPELSDTRVTHDPAEIEKKLQGEHLKIFNDHKIYRCSHFLLTDRERYCYLIYSKLKRKRLPYAHVHYVSDRDLFARAYRDIRNSIVSHCGAYFILIDSRLVENLKLPFSFCLPYRAPKQYLSSTLKPGQIDNLYSELILLDLKTHPRFKYLIRNYRRKLFGSK